MQRRLCWRPLPLDRSGRGGPVNPEKQAFRTSGRSAGARLGVSPAGTIRRPRGAPARSPQGTVSRAGRKEFQAGRKEIQAGRKEFQAGRKEIQARRKEIQMPIL